MLNIKILPTSNTTDPPVATVTYKQLFELFAIAEKSESKSI